MTRASWLRPLFPGLLLFGLSLPLSKSASNILIGALYAWAAAGALYNKEFRADVVRCCRQPLTASLALFSLVAYLGILHTEKMSDGFSVANKFVSLPAIYFFVSVLLQSDQREDARTRKAEALLFSFLAGLTALNLLGALTFLGLVGEASFTLPLSPLGLHHIWYSNINALGLYTAASFLLFTRYGTAVRGRVCLGGFLLLSSLCILLSTSRTAWFGIVFSAASLVAVLVKSRKTILLALLFAVLTFAAAYRFVPLVQERIDLAANDIALYSADKNAESSTGGRLLMWRVAFVMFKSSPLIGVGTGDFVPVKKELKRTSKLVPGFLVRFNQPHNIYLFSMATNGIVGLAALLNIFFQCLRSAGLTIRSEGRANLFTFLAVATTVHFMAAGFMDSFFNIQILRFSFAFIMGVCLRGAANSAPRP